MKKAILTWLGAAFCAWQVSAAELLGRIVRVSDGDTVTLLDAAKTQHKIRLLNIDAPESSQDFGQKSKARLAELIAGRDVRVDYAEKDMYGRVLGVIYVDALNVNLTMVKEGWAWRYHYCKDEVYGAAETAARAARLGLWAGAKPEDPWAYRKRTKAPANAAAPAPTPAAGTSATPSAGRREYRAGRGPIESRTAAPVNDDWPETGFWLSTNSGVRHNPKCPNYRKTRGYPCGKADGRPCGKCGG